MNLNCTFCHMPFMLGRDETLDALQMMQAEGLHHYDAHCPHCRHANQISRDRLEWSFPGWQAALAAASVPAKAVKPAPKQEKKPAASKAKPAEKTVSSKTTKAKTPAASKPAVPKSSIAKAEAKKPAPDATKKATVKKK